MALLQQYVLDLRKTSMKLNHRERLIVLQANEGFLGLFQPFLTE